MITTMVIGIKMSPWVRSNICTAIVTYIVFTHNCVVMDGFVLRIMVNGGVLGIMMHRLGLRDPVVCVGWRRGRRGATAVGAATTVAASA